MRTCLVSLFDMPIHIVTNHFPSLRAALALLTLWCCSRNFLVISIACCLIIFAVDSSRRCIFLTLFFANMFYLFFIDHFAFILFDVVFNKHHLLLWYDMIYHVMIL